MHCVDGRDLVLGDRPGARLDGHLRAVGRQPADAAQHVLAGQQVALDEPGVHQPGERSAQLSTDRRGAGLVQDRWKYIRYLQPGVPEELYDLTADPEELTNLASAMKHAEKLAALRKENRILREERDILKRATAFFARETR